MTQSVDIVWPLTTSGKIMQWICKDGDKVKVGDKIAICEPSMLVLASPAEGNIIFQIKKNSIIDPGYLNFVFLLCCRAYVNQMNLGISWGL